MKLHKILSIPVVLILLTIIGCIGGSDTNAPMAWYGKNSTDSNSIAKMHSGNKDNKEVYYNRMRMKQEPQVHGDYQYPEKVADSRLDHEVAAESYYLSKKPIQAIKKSRVYESKSPDTSNKWWLSNPKLSKNIKTGLNDEPLNQWDWPEYVIRTGDKISISIEMEPGSARKVTVRPDGRLQYLYGIELPAAGKTYKHLHAELVKQLSKYYRSPRVTVLPESFSGNEVFVMGAIQNPGKYKIQADTRLLDVLSQIGLLGASSYSRSTDIAGTVIESGGGGNVGGNIDLESSYIARGDRTLPINIKSLLLNRDMSQNIFLRPKDFLFFPSIYTRENRIYLLGEVREPQIVYFSGKKSFMEILLSSKTNNSSTGSSINVRFALQRGILIVRKGLKKPIKLDFIRMQQGKDPDIYLQNNDIVYVPKRTLARVSQDTTQVIDEIIAPLNSLLKIHEVGKNYYQKQWQWSTQGKSRGLGNSKDD